MIDKKLLLATTLLITSCSSTYKRPESIAEKMARFNPKDITTNPVPKYMVKKYERPKKRFPASAHVKLNYNNKNIYFLSLHDQYQAFLELFPRYGTTLNHCPKFHQSFLSQKEAPKSHKWVKKSWSDKKESILYSLTRNGKKLTGVTSASVTLAMKDHIHRNYDELVELCTTGTSSNYYIYENLITLEKKENVVKRNTNGLNILLKTPIYYNKALLNTLATKKKVKSRGLASKTQKKDFTMEALHRIGGKWADRLFE